MISLRKYFLNQFENIVSYFRALKTLVFNDFFYYKGLKFYRDENDFFYKFLKNNKTNINPFLEHCLIHNIKSSNDIFLDIGAHHGFTSLYRPLNIKYKIIAVEPSYRERSILKINRILNKIDVDIIPYAIFDKEEYKLLKISGHTNSGKNTFLTEDNFNDEEKTGNTSKLVYGNKLSKFISRKDLINIKVIKIDTEGSELDIIHGLVDSLNLLQDTMFIIEIFPRLLLRNGQNFVDIYSIMYNQGFIYKYGYEDKKNTDDEYEEIFFNKTFVNDFNELKNHE